MKLFFVPTSPYARKVRAVAVETGQVSRIETVIATLNIGDAELNRHNPLGKVPTLVTDDGVALFDSPMICEYLDRLHDGPRLFPAEGPARWTALRQQAQADGILDAAVARRYESLRPEDLQWKDWHVLQAAKIVRALDMFETEIADGGLTEVTIGPITLACALGYLDLRFPEDAWRSGRPNLTRFFETFSARPCMIETAFPET